MKYILEGEPTAWARAGLAGRKLYDTQKHLKLVMGITLKNQHDDRPFYTGPLILDITFIMKIPSKAKEPSEWEGTPTRSKPDLSNLIKLVEDTATGILYKDDCLIYKINAERVYGENPRTEFTIREVYEEK